MALRIEITPITDFMQNCCIVWDDETMEGAVTDVGGDVDKLLKRIDDHGVQVKEIWLTHGHVDHVAGVSDFASKRNVKIVGPAREDDFWIEASPEISRSYGFREEARVFEPDRWLKDGDVLKVGSQEFEVLQIPGHTPGSVVFHSKRNKVLIAGDVLFFESIGRTDFPQSDFKSLVDNIKSKLFSLPDETVVIPGHGPNTTIGHEKRFNPYFK